MHFTLLLYSQFFPTHIDLPLASSRVLYAGLSTIKEACNIAHLTECPPSPHISLQLACARLFCFTSHSSQWLSVLANSISSPPFCPQWNHAGQDRGDLHIPVHPLFLSPWLIWHTENLWHCWSLLPHQTFSLLQFSDTHALLLVLAHFAVIPGSFPAPLSNLLIMLTSICPGIRLRHLS